MPLEILQSNSTSSDLIGFGKTVWDTFMSPQLQADLFPFKITFIVFSVLFLGVSIYLLMYTTFLKWMPYVGSIKTFFKPFSPNNIKFLKNKWKKIEKEVDKSQLVNWKIGLLKALEIVEKVLLERQAESRGLDEILSKLTVDELANIDELQKAYQLCQDIIHDPDFKITHSQAKEALGVFEQSLKELDYF